MLSQERQSEREEEEGGGQDKGSDMVFRRLG